MHTVVFSPQAEETRAFFRDVLGLPSADAGGGWLIFALPPAELAVHPADGAGRRELYLMCDDIQATLAELRTKGIDATEVTDQGWGRLAAIRLPDGSELPVYEPRHASPLRTPADTLRTPAEADVVTKLSPRPVPGTVARLTSLISAKRMKLFAVIDQAQEARQAGLTLPDTTLVIFGSPAAGTPVMAASPLSALDLPLKVLVWADGGQTKVSYYAPAALAAGHRLSADVAGDLSGIHALTDALVES